MDFFFNFQNYAGGWLEFHFMAHALPAGLAGHLDQVILFMWPKNGRFYHFPYSSSHEKK